VPNPIFLFLRRFLSFRKKRLESNVKKERKNDLIFSSLRRGKPSGHIIFSTKNDIKNKTTLK